MKSSLQGTIDQELEWKGIGLHTGLVTGVKVVPANAHHGLRWGRSDVAGMTPIKAELRYVCSTTRSTDIKSGDNEIRTIEHLMSALHGAGIHNATIWVDGPEVPILDGSAHDFYSQLLAHRIETDEEVDTWCAASTFSIEDAISGASYTYLPSDEALTIELIMEYEDHRMGQKYASYTSHQDYGKEIAEARTFVRSSELLQLAQAGLIKGGDLANAIVIPSENTKREDLENVLQLLGRSNIDAIVQHIEAGFQLKYDNELARHKILDLLGDLALLGFSLRGRIIARRAGHTGNIAFAKELYARYKKDQKLRGLPIYDPSRPPIYTTEQVMSFLPHRYPFMLVDKIIELSDTHVVGIKNITFNEQLFQGHFPNNPVFPGVLQMEALAQTGGILALHTVEHPSNWDTYFLKMDHVKFKNMVRPGDTMILKMELLSPIRRGIVQMKGTAFVGDKIVSEGELTAQIVDRTK